MILELLNWIGVILTIFGTWEVSRKHSRLLAVNTVYTIAFLLLIMVFVMYQNWAMVVMYSILCGFGIHGIYIHRRHI